MDDLKADKESLDKTNALIENLNDKVKHLSIIQNELALSLAPINKNIGNFDEKG